MELELPPELVVHVFAQAPILALPRLALVCRAWADASRSDDVWHAVIARRWSFSRHSFGARFPCWRDVFLTLLAIDPREQMHSSSNGMIIELNVLSCSARSFILGIARDGWFPTADGIFTYHEEARERTLDAPSPPRCIYFLLTGLLGRSSLPPSYSLYLLLLRARRRCTTDTSSSQIRSIPSLPTSFVWGASGDGAAIA